MTIAVGRAQEQGGLTSLTTGSSAIVLFLWGGPGSFYSLVPSWPWEVGSPASPSFHPGIATALPAPFWKGVIF